MAYFDTIIKGKGEEDKAVVPAEHVILLCS